jgi:hypothetical protein
VQFVFERGLPRLLGACCLAAVASAMGCTSAKIAPADGGSGGTVGSSGAAGTGGDAAGTSGGSAGTSGGSAGTTGGLAGTGGSGGRGGAGNAGGSAGTQGGSGGSAPTGTAGSGGAGRGGAAGTTAAGGAAGTTAAGGGAGTAAGGGAGGASSGGGAGGAAPAVTPTVAGQIVVTELMHDTNVVSDDFGEWFEIYNPDAATTYDLFGCQIRDSANAHTINAHLLAPPNAFRTLAIFSTGGGFVPDYTYSGIKFDNDNADSVSIYCGTTLIDRFSYSAAQAAMGGHSFSVDPAHYNSVDNDDPANFCLATTIYNQAVSGSNVVSDYGTPGVTNSPCK